MCGILCIICNSNNINNVPEEINELRDGILRRGPDSYNYKKCMSRLCFAASVLWLQGKQLTNQPIENENSLFIYNGDVFGGNINDELKKDIGDTKLFLNALENSNEISKVLSDIHGPYAFIYLNKSTSKLYFGRDIFGRRSLLIGKHEEKIILTSVAKRNMSYELLELPSIGTFCLDLSNKNFCIYPWQYRNQNFDFKLQELIEFIGQNIEIEHQLKILENRQFIEPRDCDISLFQSLTKDNYFEDLLNNQVWFKKVEKLQDLLENAVRKRIATQPEFCRNCIATKNSCHHATTGVLFSGGIDCSILALLADKFTDKNRPIDLINVAFDEKNNYETPDRLTGLQSFKELQSLCPDRCWKFVPVNVSKEELNSEREKQIADLIYPLNTILDDSLGCALWFAARGQMNNYISPCRVLLVGMGADELFGGYTRHRASLKKDGWKGLHDVLNIDWQNLSHRNLARDDRVVSDHGKQLRTPFLDENVVEFVRNLNSWEKTYPGSDIPQGVGEKILLRSLGFHLGLRNAATFKKRALQFGSRIANSKENAHEVSVRLLINKMK